MRFRCTLVTAEGRILQRLNGKKPRAYELASEIAGLTGESMTGVVITSLEKRLEAEKVRRGGKSKAERMRELGRTFKEGMAPGSHSSGHADLYDENGLPF